MKPTSALSTGAIFLAFGPAVTTFVYLLLEGILFLTIHRHVNDFVPILDFLNQFEVVGLIISYLAFNLFFALLNWALNGVRAFWFSLMIIPLTTVALVVFGIVFGLAYIMGLGTIMQNAGH